MKCRKNTHGIDIFHVFHLECSPFYWIDFFCVCIYLKRKLAIVSCATPIKFSSWLQNTLHTALTSHGYSTFNLFCQPSEWMAIKTGWFQSLKIHNNPAYPWHWPPIITALLCACVLKIHPESLNAFCRPSWRLGGKKKATLLHCSGLDW